MEQLSLSNNLFFIEWGTYIVIGALSSLLYLYFSKQSPYHVKMTDFLVSYGKRVPLQLLVSLTLFFILILFVIFLLYRNERVPTLEVALPVLLLFSPSVLLVGFHIYETSKGGK